MNHHEPQPLKGITIIDCSVLLPGPFIGKLLLDQGARVLKVENPKRRDPAIDLGAGGFYDYLNTGKELVLIDLTTSEGKAQMRELILHADGLIDSFRPSAKKKLGLDEESLHAVNPALSIVSLVGYPENGPHRERAGHDLNFQAVSGALSLFGGMPGLPLSEIVAGYEGALALASDIGCVQRGGKAIRRSISISEALKKAQGRFVLEAKKSGSMPEFGTTLITGKYPCYNIYHANDGRRFAFAAMEEKFWINLCDILNLNHLAEKRFSEGTEGAQVKQQIQKVLATKNSTEWLPLFMERDCCVELVAEYSEVFNLGATPAPMLGATQ